MYIYIYLYIIRDLFFIIHMYDMACFAAEGGLNFLLYFSRASSCVMQQSMILEYEPASEPLHISAKHLFLH